ncbi:hypothetical protein POM88_018539 [Heracleum sosnowskyi]|uniref:Uncharacterized protein n=1 Tax=Heracleum sosnowskyi TaxID=360622 RepID=A0AAD8MZB9_9APIA|nr:hypothetical protein POM88_018539 [Heracleum sosnowskyi]
MEDSLVPQKVQAFQGKPSVLASVPFLGCSTKQDQCWINTTSDEGVVSLEYYRKVNIAEEPGSENRPAAVERVMEFRSVFIESQSWSPEDAPPALHAASSQHQMTNIAEMMVAHGFAEVIRHR